MAKSFEGTYKLQGLTNADVAIASVTIKVANDGSIVFSDANGRVHEFSPSGEVALLLKLAFTGAGGPASRFFV